MTKEIDYKTLDKILAFNKMGNEEVTILEEFIRKHIDPNCRNLCRRCKTEKEFAWRRVQAFNKSLKR